MRKITLLAFVLMGFFANAQIYYYLPAGSGNPGGLNADDEYPVGGGLDPSWSSILTGGQPASGTWSTTQTVPFTFNFNGTAESSYKVSSNGVLTFDVSSTATPGNTAKTLPSSDLPDKSVVVWGITGTGSSDQIATKTFGTAPNRQHWIFFSSYTIPGAASSWTYWSIVLEEGTNNIYIVDQRNANGTLAATLGVQVNSTTAYQVQGSPNIACASGADPTPADNVYYAFLPGPQPTYDATCSDVDMDPFLVLANAPFDIEADFMNLGTATITSADINYSINGGAAVTSNLTGLNMSTYGSATLTHPTTWNPSVGTYTVEVWLSNINGNADEKTANDKYSVSVDVVANATTRYPLYETFTSSTCPPCVPANINMEGLFATNAGDQVSLKYQMSWPGAGDPYYTDEGGVRRSYYSVNSVPNVAIDGGWNNNGNSLTQAIMDQYKAVPAFVDITANYSISGQTLTMDIFLDPVADINVNDLKLHVAIKEVQTEDNARTNGETEFKDVMKKMVPDANGTSIPALQQGNTVKKSFTYTFQGSYREPNNASDPINHAIEHSVEDFNELTIVAWLQSEGTKEVYQAAEGQWHIGIEDFDAEKHNLSVFPNPASDFAYVNIDMTEKANATMNVVNMLGQTVETVNAELVSGNNKVRVNTADLAAGVYFMQVEIDGQVETIKFTVQ